MRPPRDIIDVIFYLMREGTPKIRALVRRELEEV
jgi:hypothetical protein